MSAAAEATQHYRSLTQIIVEMMRSRIYEGEYRPGARLNISDLAQQFNVSPVPVREALRNLETEGLVTFRLNKGVVVRELSAKEVRELFLIRVPLETLAIAEAAPLADKAALARLRAILKRMDPLAGSEEYHALHNAFHAELYGLAQLPRLSQLIDVLRGQMRPYSKLYLASVEHVRQAQVEHYELLELLESRDAARLRRLIHEHLARPARMALAGLGETDMTLEIDA